MTVGAMMQAREAETPLAEEPPLTKRDSFVRLGILVAVLAVIGFLDWGWLAFIFVLLVSVVLHELGHFLLARKGGMRASEFFVGFGPRIWSVKRGETEFGIKAILAGGYVKTPGMTNLEDDIPPELESRTFRAQSYGRRARMILAGPFTNLLLALLSFCALFMFYNEKVYKDTGTPTVTVGTTGPAVAAGLRTSDQIVTVDGQSFTTIENVVAYVKAHPGATVSLGVVREGVAQTIPVTLAATNPAGDAVGFLGVSFGGVESQIARNPLQAVGRGFGEVGYETKETVLGIGRIFSPSGIVKLFDTVTGQRKDDPTQRASSVVGIGKESSTVFRTGFENSLYLFGALNLALGLFNLLPIIPFDGGHFVIATYERLRSRRDKPYRVDFAKVVPFFAPLMAVVAFVVLSSFLLDIKR